MNKLSDDSMKIIEELKTIPELITFFDITKSAKIARSTIKRRCEALDIKLSHVKKDGAGRPMAAITKEQMNLVVHFDHDLFNGDKYMKSVEESLSNLNISKRFIQKPKKSLNAENHRRGLYQRVTAYGGVLSWEGLYEM